jgi:peptidoglycan/LPS O-acetylase OafA/YrhL
MAENKNKKTTPPENEKPKKGFNYKLLIQIMGGAVALACLFVTIYQAVVYYECEEWCPLFTYVSIILLAISIFPKTFAISEKSFRNRILLYVGTVVLLCIPNLVGTLVEFSSGAYLNDPEVLDVISKYNLQDAPGSARNIILIAEVMVVVFLAAILTLCIEMMLRSNLKKKSASD